MSMDTAALREALAAEGIIVTPEMGDAYLSLGIGIYLHEDHGNLAGLIQLPPTVRHHTEEQVQREIAAETAMHVAIALKQLHPDVVSHACWDDGAVIITLA